MAQNPNLAALSAAGVSVWLDDLSRDRLQTGNLQELIDTEAQVEYSSQGATYRCDSALLERRRSMSNRTHH